MKLDKKFQIAQFLKMDKPEKENGTTNGVLSYLYYNNKKKIFSELLLHLMRNQFSNCVIDKMLDEFTLD